MAIVYSRIEDGTHVYNIPNGSGRYGHLVYHTNTLAYEVNLARANTLLSSRVVGAITYDYGTTVELAFSGSDVELVCQTGIIPNPGDTLWLSKTEPGRVTTVAPDYPGVVVIVGDVARYLGGSLVQVSFNISEPKVL